MSVPPSTRRTVRAWLCLTAMVMVIVLGAAWLWRPRLAHPAARQPSNVTSLVADSARSIDGAMAAQWSRAGLEPAPRASDLTIVRRLSLALTGAVPSLEDIRAFEGLPDNLRLERWAAMLLDDSRSADYVAERLARAYVGVEGGPFLVYRRSGLVRWLSGQIQSGRPYDAMVRDLITAEGLWTTNPAANFITASIDNNNQKEGPDQIMLAIRTTRAFLGVRIDCVQCHDDPFGERWKQADFHRLAAYFAGAEMKFTGVRDDRKNVHEVRYRGETEEHAVLPEVPFFPHLLPGKGRPRERLAAWVTHPE